MNMQMWMRRARLTVTAMIGSGAAAMLAGPAAATPTVVGIGAFSGSETVIDFTGLGSGEMITNQFAGEGVTFSGGLYATYLVGNPAPSAQNYPLFTPAAAAPITIDFSSTMLRVGFDVLSGAPTGDQLMVDVEAYREGSLVSTFQFATGTSFSFVGLEDDMLGIDRLVLSANNPSTGSKGFVMDNLRFEAASAVVPEPSAALLFPVGLILAASRIRRREGRVA